MSRAVREDGGQVLALVGLFLATILLGLGLAVDVGQLLAARRAGQVAADAGAWAGAVRLYNAGTNTQAKSAARADAALNGFATGSPAGTVVTVDSPPDSGAFEDDDAYVEVVVEQQVATTFFRAVRALTTVTTRAVAGVRGSGGTLDGILVLYSGDTDSALNLSSSGTKVVVNYGSVQVNSSSSASVAISSGSAGPRLSATAIRLRGSASSTVRGLMSPTPSTGAALEANPIASLAKPSTGGLSVFGARDIDGVSTTLAPGIYNGGIRVRNGGTATFQAGIYILRGGGSNYGLTTTGASRLLRQNPWDGVLIFNTNSTYPSSGSSCGQISMAATGTVDLAAPASGTYDGLLLWQDPNCTGDQAMTVTSSWTNFVGTVYLPGSGSRLTMTMSNSVALGTQLVVNRLTVVNSRTLTLNISPARIFGKAPTLVE